MESGGEENIQGDEPENGREKRVTKRKLQSVYDKIVLKFLLFDKIILIINKKNATCKDVYDGLPHKCVYVSLLCFFF